MKQQPLHVEVSAVRPDAANNVAPVQLHCTFADSDSKVQVSCPGLFVCSASPAAFRVQQLDNSSSHCEPFKRDPAFEERAKHHAGDRNAVHLHSRG